MDFSTETQSLSGLWTPEQISSFLYDTTTRLPESHRTTSCFNIKQPETVENGRPFRKLQWFPVFKKKKVFKFIYQDSDRTGAKIHCSWFKVQGSLLGYTSLESNAVFPNPDCTLANVGHALKNTDTWSQDPRTCGFVNPAGIILSNQGNTCLIHSSEISGTVINIIQSKQSWTCQSVKSKCLSPLSLWTSLHFRNQRSVSLCNLYIPLYVMFSHQ